MILLHLRIHSESDCMGGARLRLTPGPRRSSRERDIGKPAKQPKLVICPAFLIHFAERFRFVHIDSLPVNDFFDNLKH